MAAVHGRHEIYLRPIRPIQSPILNGFRNVLAFELESAFEVGDGAGHFQDAVVGTGA